MQSHYSNNKQYMYSLRIRKKMRLEMKFGASRRYHTYMWCKSKENMKVHMHR